MSDKEILEDFGELIIQAVRDTTIKKYKMIQTGKMKSQEALRLHEKLKSLSPENLVLINEIVVGTVGDALHNFLWLLEEQDEDTELKYKNKNVAHLSDGLCGELYSDEGWIKKYSKYETGEIY